MRKLRKTTYVLVLMIKKERVIYGSNAAIVDRTNAV